MATGIDAKTVLRAVADHPEAFPAVQSDLNDFARKAVTKQLKDKSTTTDLFKQICRAAGEAAVATVLDGFGANEVAGLVKKIDVHSTHAKAGEDIEAARRHVLAIGAGRSEPAPKASKAEKEKKAPATKTATAKPKIGDILGSKVHDGGKRKTTRPKKTG